MDIASLRKLLDHLDAAPVECDGMARLVVTCLDAAGIPYRAMCGNITNGDQVIAPHFWVEVDQHRIDYRARMWLGESSDIPHGVFPSAKSGAAQYQGHEFPLEPLDPFLVEVLSTPIPQSMLRTPGMR